jgi:hypothetical protein
MYMRKSRSQVPKPEELHVLQYPRFMVMKNLITQRTEEFYFKIRNYCGG